MARTTYTAPISAEEKAEFVPFLNRLIDTAFDEIVPRFLTGIAVEDKTNGTPVTQADKTAEEKMRLLIEKTYPEHGIFGEEWGEKEVSHNSEGVRYRWILDPVDGTKSFITNSFLFGTLIALERDDGTGFRPILSSISHAAANVRTIGTLDGTHMHLENRGTVDGRLLRLLCGGKCRGRHHDRPGTLLLGCGRTSSCGGRRGRCHHVDDGRQPLKGNQRGLHRRRHSR